MSRSSLSAGTSWELSGARLRQDHRDLPQKRGRRLIVQREALLLQLELTFSLLAGRGNLQERETRLLHPTPRHADQWFSRGFLQRGPEVRGGGVRISMSRNVLPQTVSKDLLSKISLQHKQHSATLFIGDLIKTMNYIRRMRYRHAHRMGCPERIGSHRPSLRSTGANADKVITSRRKRR
jgi:hypothetical protein